MTGDGESPQNSEGGFKLLSEDEAAAALTLSTRTLQGLRLNGGGPPYVRLGERRIAYAPESLREWARERTTRNTAAGDLRGARGK